ncbi:unnamed protein product [Paramecium pentaurelia]|uniref:Uncharacterized protein n=1 Tax=Paramecium pentaurelia TaxID=43138 RepID=A0A8S1V684_9CILI|nr:unnamed protein product [Paramecium pentaurelia]
MKYKRNLLTLSVIDFIRFSKKKKTCLKIVDSLAKDESQSFHQSIPLILEKINHLEGFEEFLDVTQIAIRIHHIIYQLLYRVLQQQKYLKLHYEQNKLVRYISIYIQKMLNQKAFVSKDVLPTQQSSKLFNQLKHKRQHFDKYSNFYYQHFIYVT